MRFLVGIFLFTSSYAVAVEPLVVPPVPVQPVLEWNNARPEQRQALDHFYRSLEQHQAQDMMVQRLQRQQHIDQLRDMSPEQRQQQFLKFVQQHQTQQQQLLMPTP